MTYLQIPALKVSIMMTNVGKMYWWAKITVWIVVFWPLSANFLMNQAEVLYAVRFFVTPTDIILLICFKF